MTIAHELPSMPQFPPLEMPSPTATDPDPVVVPKPGAPEFLKSPVPSFADSFSTAYTSPDREDDAEDYHRLLAPPLNHQLRKSISVDSFHNASLNGTRAHRSNTSAQLESPRSPTFQQANSQSDDREQIWAGRGRGASVSSVQEGYESPSLLDSDVERFDPINVPTDRYRLVSLKGQETQRPTPRGGELLLPARSPAGLSATSSMSSIISGSGNSSPKEAHPALRSVTSLQASSLRTSQVSIKNIGRARSGSLGVHVVSTPARRMTINTHFDTSKSTPLVTLAVIGTSATGKSSVIRKGLANYHLSESTVTHAPDNPSIRYSRRTGRIPSDSLPEGSLTIIEVDVPPEITDLPPLPPDLPPLDGVMVCYDASNSKTFLPVETMLKGYRAIKLPIIVLACKVDLEKRIAPDRALELLQEYDVGLVEVTTAQDGGKGKMRQSFDWLVKAVFRARQSQAHNDNRNPASPEYLRNPSQPWDSARTSTPTAASSAVSGVNSVPFDSAHSNNASPSVSPSIPPITPTSPTRARSTGDLLAERDKARSRTEAETSPPAAFAQRPRGDSGATKETTPSPTLGVVPVVAPKPAERLKKDPPAAQWATLDELLDKLLFLAVSGDDPAFISHFLLTYRRFATPRSVLLAMQKRMRQLDSPCGDPMFACFAQMRICYLLETWIRDYPDDFAVKGTAGALNALIKSIISKTHLLHYGSEFLPFLEMLPSRADHDASWAMKADVSAEESDDSYSFLEEDEDEDETPSPQTQNESPRAPPSPEQPMAVRERKSSIPLGKAIISNPGLNELSPKQHLKDLVKLANDVVNCDAEDVAQEITRQWVKRFLAIQPRDWLHYVFISSKKSETDRITEFNVISNHLGDWVVSLILCHDRPRNRARQIEKFVDIAHRLRVLNNYSALRAVVAGINASTFPGDETMELFKAKSPEQAKNLQSFDVLLQSIRAHRAYRLALRNSKGACIPAMEVHMSDLIRANEGNDDINEADPSKIHWGKFNMMGRFVDTTSQCQVQCQNSSDYEFPERSAIAELLLRRPVMSIEMQKSRIASPDGDYDDVRPSNPSQPKDIAVLRKVFFW